MMQKAMLSQPMMELGEGLKAIERVLSNEYYQWYMDVFKPEDGRAVWPPDWSKIPKKEEC